MVHGTRTMPVDAVFATAYCMTTAAGEDARITMPGLTSGIDPVKIAALLTTILLSGYMVAVG
jgi:hypothetical protein